jgi:hypothetical protein
MKRQIILLALILGGWTCVSGQSPTLSATPQLYIVKAQDKTLITDSNGIWVKDIVTNSNLLVYVNPAWIDKVEVVKGKDATDKYGTNGKNGVIILTLTKNGFDKMRLSDKERFKKNE